VVITLLPTGCGTSENSDIKPDRVSNHTHIPQIVQAHLRAERFQEAVDAASAGLKMDSTSAELNNMLATAEASQGRYQAAIDALKRALRHHPNFALAHLNLGGIFTKLGQFDKVEVSLKKALKLEPNWSSVHRRLTELYLGRDRPEEAKDAILQAIQIFPEEATHLFYLGRSLEATGEIEAALAAFQEAVDLDIGFGEALYRLSLLARRLNRQTLADSALARFGRLQQIGSDATAPKVLKKLRSSVMNAPEDAAHHFNLGKFFARQGFWEEALNKFDRVAALAKADKRRLNQIGSLLMEGSRPQNAIPYYSIAIATDSTFVPALVNMGAALDLTDRGPEARYHYEKALVLSPEDANIYFAYGLSHIKANQTEAALAKLKQGKDLTESGSLLQSKFDDAITTAIQIRQ